LAAPSRAVPPRARAGVGRTQRTTAGQRSMAGQKAAVARTLLKTVRSEEEGAIVEHAGKGLGLRYETGMFLG
jgi:hypothetical protein